MRNRRAPSRGGRFVLPLALALCPLSVSCLSQALAEARALAHETDERLASSKARIEDSPAENYLEELADDVLEGARLLDAVERSHETVPAGIVDRASPVALPFALDIYDGIRAYLIHELGPNAATPGDECTEVTTRLFLEAEAPEQLVGVLAHEVGHMRSFHVVKKILRRQRFTAAVVATAALGAYADAQAAAVDPNHVSTDWGEWARRVLSAYVPWRKEDEFEADLRGLRIYMELGYDPEVYLSIFDLLGRWNAEESDSHPAPRRRKARLEEWLATGARFGPYKRIDAERFQLARAELAETLHELALRGELVTYTEEVYTMALSGATVPPLFACGAPGPDPATETARFWGIAASRRGPEEPFSGR